MVQAQADEVGQAQKLAAQLDQAAEQKRLNAERLAKSESDRQLGEKQAQQLARDAQVAQQKRQESQRLQTQPTNQKFTAALATSFVERSGLLMRPIQLATAKLERLIELPAGIEQGLPTPRQDLQALPVNRNFMVDVERLTQTQKDIRRFDTLIALNPNSPSAHYQRANFHYSVSDFTSALRDYSRSLELNPSQMAALVNRGAIRRKTGDLTGAIHDYDQAIQLAPGDSVAHRNRGIARELIGDLEGAIADWQRAATLGDDEARQWIALASSSQVLDSPVQALIQMHERNQPQKPAAQSLPFPAAINARLQNLTVALMSKPRDMQLLYQRGTELLKGGALEQAIADFSAILQAAPNSIKAIFNRAVARRQAGDLDGSLADYSRVIELAPQDHEAYRNRGIVKQMLGSQTAACADWGTASALGNSEAKTWVRNECK
ncbi:tetratricopeptide repeat protein [Cyanobium sp. A1C-AMD]|uniref:tetratricopeptide repeat protein n=1 Tax=Cyanobium sp. A1C-AMD TaxID=2823694 RepID=UPI0020CCEA26|nr:tetratricopeptide repeat protein [Cyanobium sp. A1C-AMD]